MALPVAARLAALAVCLVPVSSMALPISKYQALTMPCENVRATIANEGAAVFRWTEAPDVDRYGRYVDNVNYCFPGEVVKTVFIPAADANYCPVLECQIPMFSF